MRKMVAAYRQSYPDHVPGIHVRYVFSEGVPTFFLSDYRKDPYGVDPDASVKRFLEARSPDRQHRRNLGSEQAG